MYKLNSLLIIVAYFCSYLQNKIVLGNTTETQFSSDVLLENITEEPEKTFYVRHGSIAKTGQFPYVVSLQNKQNFHLCGGGIISSKHVLSAAHCLCGRKSIKAENVVIVAGIVNYRSKRRKIYAVQDYICHPQYNDKQFYYHDLVLIRIKKHFEFSRKIQPIPLVEHTSTPVPRGLSVSLAGWGQTDNDETNLLRYIRTTTIPNTECKRRMKQIEGDDFYVIHSTICTRSLKGSQPCQGDSGSSLVYKNQMIGVFSWVAGTHCVARQPDGYISVAHYRSWIQYELTRNYN